MDIPEVRVAERDGRERRILMDQEYERKRKAEEAMYLGMSEEQKTTYRNILEQRGDYSQYVSTAASTTAPTDTAPVKKSELVRAFEQEFKAFLDVE